MTDTWRPSGGSVQPGADQVAEVLAFTGSERVARKAVARIFRVVFLRVGNHLPDDLGRREARASTIGDTERNRPRDSRGSEARAALDVEAHARVRVLLRRAASQRIGGEIAHARRR